MSISFQCCDCEAGLKVADTSAGKKCKCPTCGSVNLIPGGDTDAGGEAPQPRRVASRIAATLPQTQKRAAVADDAGAEDDGAVEEKAAAKRKKVSVKKKSGGGKMLLIGGAVALLMFGFLACTGIGGGGFAVWYFYFNDPLREEAKYFPNNTQFVLSMRPDQFNDSQFFKDVKAELGNVLTEKLVGQSQDEFGVGMDGIQRMVVAGSVDEANAMPVVIIHTKKTILASDILAGIKKKDPQATYNETKVAGKTLYEGKSNVTFGMSISGMSFCVVDNTMVVFGNATTLKAILERGKAPDLPEKMKTAMKSADFSKTITVVITGMVEKKASLPGPGMVPPAPNGASNSDDIPPPESVVGYAQVDKDIVSSITLTFKDAKTAETAKTKMEKSINDAKNEPMFKAMFKDVPSDLYDCKVKTSGTKVIIDATLKGAPLTKLIHNGMGSLMNNNPGFPQQPGQGFQPPQGPGIPPQPGPKPGRPPRG